MRKHCISAIAVLILLTVSTAAYAATGTVDAAAAKDAQNIIFDLVNSIGDVADGMPSKTIALGKGILGAVIAYLVATTVVKSVLEGGGALQVIASLVGIGIPTSIIYWCITSNAANYQALNASFDIITTQVSGVAPTRGDISNTLGMFVDVVVKMLNTPDSNADKDPGIWATISSLTDTFNPATLLAMLVAYIFKLAAAFVITVAAVLYVGQMILAKYMMGIAFAMAPIMLAFGMLPVLSSLIDGVVKFAITAGLYQVIGSIIFVSTSETIKKMVAASNKAAESNIPSTILVASFALLLVAAFMAFLMMQIKDLAQGLMSGSGISISHFTRPVANAARATSAAGKAGANGAKSGAKAAGGAAKGAYRGAAHSINGMRAAAGVGAKAGKAAAGATSSAAQQGSMARSASKATDKNMGGGGPGAWNAVKSEAKASTQGVRAFSESMGQSAASGAKAAGARTAEATKSAGSRAATSAKEGIRNFHNHMMGRPQPKSANGGGGQAPIKAPGGGQSPTKAPNGGASTMKPKLQGGTP